DILGQRAQPFGAELARLALQRVRRHDEATGVAGAHRILDRRHRLDPILAKIAENAHESGAQLGARRAEFIPIDQDLVQCSVPWCSFGPWSLPPSMTKLGKKAVTARYPTRNRAA